MKFIEHLSKNRKWYILALGILWTAFIWGCPTCIRITSYIPNRTYDFAFLYQEFITPLHNNLFITILFIANCFILTITLILCAFFNKKWSKILFAIISISLIISMILFSYLVFLYGITDMRKGGLNIIYFTFNLVFMILTYFIVFIDNIKNKKQQPKKQSDKERIAELEKQVEELKRDKEN